MDKDDASLPSSGGQSNDKLSEAADDGRRVTRSKAKNWFKVGGASEAASSSSEPSFSRSTVNSDTQSKGSISEHDEKTKHAASKGAIPKVPQARKVKNRDKNMKHAKVATDEKHPPRPEHLENEEKPRETGGLRSVPKVSPLLPTEVKKIVDAAMEDANEVPAYHILYNELLNWDHHADDNVPWLVRHFVEKKNDTVKEEERINKKIEQILVCLAYNVHKISDKLKPVCRLKNPEVKEQEVVYLRRDERAAGNIDLYSSSDEDEADNDHFYLEFDASLPLPPVGIVLEGSESGGDPNGLLKRKSSHIHITRSLMTIQEEPAEHENPGQSGRDDRPSLNAGLKSDKAIRLQVEKAKLEEEEDQKGDGVAPDGCLSELKTLSFAQRLARREAYFRKCKEAVQLVGKADGDNKKPDTQNSAHGQDGKKGLRGKKQADKSGKRWIDPDTFKHRSSFPNSVKGIEDTEGVFCTIFRVCFLNAFMHLILDIAAQAKDAVDIDICQRFIEAISAHAYKTCRNFGRGAFKRRSHYLNLGQAAQWANLARFIVQSLNPGITMEANSFFYKDPIKIAMSEVLRILGISSVTRKYCYEKMPRHKNQCKHGAEFEEEDIGLPYSEFKYAVEHGERRSLKVHPCPFCGAQINMEMKPFDTGFFVTFPSGGKGMTKAEFSDFLPPRVCIDKVFYRLKGAVVALIPFADIGHATTLIPGNDEQIWIFDDGTYVDGKQKSRNFAVALLLACYVKDQVQHK